jgi:lipopolysaccharide export system permease protein
MGLINRYIILVVLKAMFVVLCITLAVNTFVAIAHEIDNVGEGGYTFLVLLKYILMTSPSSLYSFFPMIGLIGAIVGLGGLASNSELIVMRASGYSVGQIVRSVFIAALIAGVFMVSVGELVAPTLMHKAEVFKKRSRSSGDSIETQHGVWMRVGSDFFHVNRVLDRNKLYGVDRYHVTEQGKLAFVQRAVTLSYSKEGWLAHGVMETVISDDHIDAQKYKKQLWDLELKPDALAYGYDDPMQMTLWNLSDFIGYRAEVGLPVSQYLLVFWQRILQPLSLMVMVMLAIPFIFATARSGTMGLRIVLGAVCGLAFYLLNQFAGQFSVVYQLPGWLGALFPVLLFSLLGIYLLNRVR